MADTKIEWADAVWNPVTGCQKVSQGCKNCYAERLAGRFWGDRKFTDVQTHPDRLEDPLKWRKPRRIFVNSMSDLFHKDVPDEFIDRVFAVMFDANHHTFMILTKRPERMAEYLSPDNPRYTARKVFDLTKGDAGKFDCDMYWPLDNVWLGVSVEDQKAADDRVPWLLKVPAAVRFLSCEPMLGPVDISWWTEKCPGCGESPKREGLNSSWRWGGQNWAHYHGYPIGYIPSIRATGIDWVISGCESGPGARPMHPDWARGLRDQCQTANIPFFLKQMVDEGKIKKLPELDGKVWNQFPEVQP